MTQDFYRGDIFFIAHSPVSGSEQGGHRPGVIVSNDLANRYSPNVEVVFLTSQEKKPMPTHVPVQCKVPSTALFLSCNLRELIHMSNERLCLRAQWEIRELMKQMVSLVDPALHFMLVPKCKSGRIVCHEKCGGVDDGE